MDLAGQAPRNAATDSSPTHLPAAAGRDIAVIGASAGGVPALQRLAATLPPDHPGALCIVVHISPDAQGDLANILSRAGPLPAVAAEDGMALAPGRLHVAPPDRHLLIDDGRLQVVRGPRENRHRPAIDPLFRSAAWSHGPRVVGVVLTGKLDDGTAGLWAIKSCGGTTVIQDPAEAEYPEMPANAQAHTTVDHCLPLAGIGPLLTRLAFEPLPVAPAVAAAGQREAFRDEVELASMDSGLSRTGPLGEPTPFTCPSCGGALWELQEGGHLRYRCHTGHGYSGRSLLAEQTDAIEESLFVAMRAVEEKAAALLRLAAGWTDGLPRMKEDYERRAQALLRSAETLRHLLADKSA